MSVSLILACLWVLVATAIALMPRRFHVPGAAVLALIAIPLLGYVTWQHGALVGVLALAGAASILGWPLRHLFLRLQRLAGRQG